MKDFIKGFIKEEDGISTVEIVVIIAILVGLALLFKNSITKFVTDIFTRISGKQDQIITK